LKLAPILLVLAGCGGGSYDLTVTVEGQDDVLDSLKCVIGYSYDAARDVCVERPKEPAPAASAASGV
jgi:hypothetical protein